MENTAEIFNAITEQPCYLHSSIVSQAHNISKSSKFTLEDRENLCFLAACCAFILERGATCFASPALLINKYNEFALTFNVKNTYLKKFRMIQERAIKLGMISYRKEFDHARGQTRRHIKPVLTKLNELLPAAIKKAGRHALCWIERQADKAKSLLNNCAQTNFSAATGTYGGHDLKTREKPININALEQSQQAKLARIRSNTRSKEYNNNPTVSKCDVSQQIDADFYKRKFKSDALEAQILQTQARNGIITALGAKRLIALHTAHAVRLGEKFAGYLKSVIIGDKQARQAKRQANAYKSTPIKRSTLDILDEKIANFFSG